MKHYESPVPLRIHQIWLGSRELPSPCEPWIRSWAETHPGWEQKLWRDDDIVKLKDEFVCQAMFLYPQNPALLSDVLRLELLYRFGGIYVDTDFAAYRYIGHLLQPGCFHYGDELAGRPGNAFMASPPGHPFVKACLDHLNGTLQATIDTRADWVEVVRRTGPEFLAAALHLQVKEWSCREIRDRGVAVGGIWPNGIVSFWSEYFYPYGYHQHQWPQFSVDRYPMCYTAHHWLGTWQDLDPFFVTGTDAPSSLAESAPLATTPAS